MTRTIVLIGVLLLLDDDNRSGVAAGDTSDFSAP